MMFLKYTYYRLNLYYANSKTGGASKFEALFSISLITYLNISMLFIWIEHLSGFNIIPDFELERHGLNQYLKGLFMALPFIIINYFLFYKNHEAIETLFKNETKKEIKIGGIKVLLFVVGTVLLFFLSIILTKGINLG